MVENVCKRCNHERYCAVNLVISVIFNLFIICVACAFEQKKKKRKRESENSIV